jgi:hypothetical protein
MSGTSPTSFAMSTGSGRNSIFPDSTLARSRTPSMNWSRWRELERVSPRNSLWLSETGPSLPSCIISAKPMMAFSGVRSSWDMLARNSLFRRLASCARRYCSSSSALCRRRRSFRATRSVASRTAAIVSHRPSTSMELRLISAGNSLPSFRRP